MFEDETKEDEVFSFSDEEIDSDWYDGSPPEEEKEEPAEEYSEEDKKESESEKESKDDEIEDHDEEKVEQKEETSEEDKKEEDAPFVTVGEDAEARSFSREEAAPLIEKGMQYDAVSQERNEALEENKRLSGLEFFLKEIADPMGITIQDLMDNTRAKVLAEREGLDEDTALQRVRLNRERAEFDAQRTQGEREAEKARVQEENKKNSFLRFAKEFPSVDPKTIPKDVWDRFNNGTDLTDAYATHENKRLRAEMEALKSELEIEKKNKENKQRSTGGARDSGKKKSGDIFDSLWYDGE